MTSDPTGSSGDLLADRRFDYAAGALADGDLETAADLLRQVLDLAPRWVPAWMKLAEAEERRGCGTAALDAYAQAAALDEAGLFGAALHVARLRGDPAPDRMPDAYVSTLFDQYAPRFDRHLVDDLGYRGPALLAQALARQSGSRRFARGLDLGCGTGLMGAAIRDRVDDLRGVDLSPAMVAEAARKTVYDTLHVDDVVRHLGRAEPASLDLIVAADVFVYLGALDPVFGAAARAMTGGGLLAFTVQTHGGAGVRLGPDLRFAHATGVVRDALERTGLTLREMTEAATRRERGVEVAGLVIVAGRS